MPSELFRPAIEQLASQLGDIGDATSSILAELARDPTAERAERAQHHLRGVQAYVAQVREAARQKAA